MNVLLIRTWHQSRELAALVSRDGFRPIIEPVIRVEELPWNASAVARAAHVVVTSPNGARQLLRCGQRLDRLSIFAVGEASAAPLRARGLAVAGTAGGTADDLLALLLVATRPDEGPILHVGGEDLAVDLAAVLSGRGYDARRSIA